MFMKFFWVIRCFFYSLVYRRVTFPGYIGKPLFLLGMKNVTFSARVRIFPNSRIEAHKDGVIWIGENGSIGQSLHLVSGGKLTIGAGTLISSNVLITNISHDYSNVELPVLEQQHIIKDTLIGENCFIGAGAVIQPGVILGRHCIVGAEAW